jgi:hypothetical protein
MSEEYNAGVVAGKAEERKAIIEALKANPGLVAECTFVNDANNTVFMPAKFIGKLDGTWVDPVVPDEDFPADE